MAAQHGMARHFTTRHGAAYVSADQQTTSQLTPLPSLPSPHSTPKLRKVYDEMCEQRKVEFARTNVNTLFEDE